MKTIRVDIENATTNVTHLMWVGRWIEVVRCEVMGEPGWKFKRGRDAADWLRYDLTDSNWCERSGKAL